MKVPNYGRKFVFGVFAILVASGASLLGIKWQGYAALFQPLVGAIVAICGLYLGSNVAQKATSKQQPPKE